MILLLTGFTTGMETHNILVLNASPLGSSREFL
jgi:hypothetical protein